MTRTFSTSCGLPSIRSAASEERTVPRLALAHAGVAGCAFTSPSMMLGFIPAYAKGILRDPRSGNGASMEATRRPLKSLDCLSRATTLCIREGNRHIVGDIGGGKSSVARILSATLLPIISAGGMQREIAASMGLHHAAAERHRRRTAALMTVSMPTPKCWADARPHHCRFAGWRGIHPGVAFKVFPVGRCTGRR